MSFMKHLAGQPRKIDGLHTFLGKPRIHIASFAPAVGRQIVLFADSHYDHSAKPECIEDFETQIELFCNQADRLFKSSNRFKQFASK